MKLDNKIILVTGVSSGIGAALQACCAATVPRGIGVDLKAPHMTLDGFVQGDLSSTESIDRLLPQLPARIVSLCNIAGVPGTANPQLLAQVNYLGLRHLSSALLPRITAGGSIVNIASILGAEWPQRLDLHKALASIEDFAAAQAWLAEHPVPGETCYQDFKEALIVWNYVQAQPWFLEHSVRMTAWRQARFSRRSSGTS